MSYTGFDNEDWPAAIGAAQVRFRVVRDVIAHPGKGAPGPMYEMGFGEYWAVEVDTGVLRNDRADLTEAWVNRRREGLQTGRLRYFRRLVPKAFRGVAQNTTAAWNSVAGNWNAVTADLSAATEPWGKPRLTAISNANGTVSLADLSPSAVISELDPIEFVLPSGRACLVRAMATRTATSAGVITAIATEPRLPDFTAAPGQPVYVTLRNASLAVRIVPGSVEDGWLGRTGYRARFIAAQPPY